MSLEAPLKAVAINCTLKPSGESSTDVMLGLLAAAFAEHAVELTETIRIAAHDVKPGVTSDEGEGDAWPEIRAKILAADILVFGGPVWMGQLGSVAKRVLERMDAFLDETDEQGRMPSYSKVAVAAIVGNEDGAHFSTAQLFQSLNDTGWTIPAIGAVYWVGEAYGSVDFKDLKDARNGRENGENGGGQCRSPRRIVEGVAISRVTPGARFALRSCRRRSTDHRVGAKGSA